MSYPQRTVEGKLLWHWVISLIVRGERMILPQCAPGTGHLIDCEYKRETVTAAEFAEILDRSGLASRRPKDDLPRLQRMIDNADLIITARMVGTDQLVGIARSITDWSYATYLSDLAVDVAFKGNGIGKRLIAETRKLAGEETMLLLVSAPDAVGFYEKIGMPQSDGAYLYPRTQ